MITHQSQVIAYNNDFWLTAIVSAPIFSLVALMRNPPQDGGDGPAAIDWGVVWVVASHRRTERRSAFRVL
jgi:hypothetical protein